MSKLRWFLNATVSALFVVALLNTYIGYASTKNEIMLVEIKGAIQPSTVDYLRRVIKTAELNESASILIELDTPGGMFESTREIVTLLLESEIPIITYVAPYGARAGSAGTFIVAASHIAAMAPTTNIGAASPVSAASPLQMRFDSIMIGNSLGSRPCWRIHPQLRLDCSPATRPFSQSRTLEPPRARKYAHDVPTTPAPITATSTASGRGSLNATGVAAVMRLVTINSFHHCVTPVDSNALGSRLGRKRVQRVGSQQSRP